MCKIQTGCFLSQPDQTDLTPGAGENSASLNIRTNSRISAGHTLAFCLILSCCFYSWLLFALRNLKRSSSETYIKISIKFTLKLLITQILKTQLRAEELLQSECLLHEHEDPNSDSNHPQNAEHGYMCLWGEQGQQNPRACLLV